MAYRSLTLLGGIAVLAGGLLEFVFGAQIAEAQGITGFAPDIVFECQKSDSSADRAKCGFVCYNVLSVITGGTGQPPISVPPPIQTKFERIEFYSEPGRNSENWLVAIRTGLVLPDGSKQKVLYTLGSANVCQYDGGGDSVVVKKLYNRPPG